MKHYFTKPVHLIYVHILLNALGPLSTFKYCNVSQLVFFEVSCGNSIDTSAHLFDPTCSTSTPSLVIHTTQPSDPYTCIHVHVCVHIRMYLCMHGIDPSSQYLLLSSIYIPEICFAHFDE